MKRTAKNSVVRLVALFLLAFCNGCALSQYLPEKETETMRLEMQKMIEKSADVQVKEKKVRSDLLAKVRSVSEDGVEVLLGVGNSEQIKSVAISPDGQIAVMSDSLGTGRVWDIASALELYTISGVKDHMAFSPNGETLVGVDGELVRTFDKRSGRQVKEFRLSPGSTPLFLSADGELLATQGSFEKFSTAMLLGRCLNNSDLLLEASRRRLSDRVFSSQARLWDVPRGTELQIFASDITPVGVLPDRRILAVARDLNTQEGSLVVLDQEGNEVHRYPAVPKINCVQVQGYSRRDLEILVEMDKSLSSNGAMLLTLSPDGRTVALQKPGDEMLLFLNLVTGDLVKWPMRIGTCTSLVFSPDGRTLATTHASYDQQRGLLTGYVDLWDVSTRRHRQRLQSVSFTFMPDGQTAFVSMLDSQIVLWDLASNKPFQQLSITTRPVSTMAAAPGGDSLVVCLDDALVLWDLVTAQISRRMEFGPDESCSSVAISQDGRTIAGQGMNGMMVLWDGETGRQLRKFQALEPTIKYGTSKLIRVAASFSADGRTLQSIGEYTYADPIRRRWDRDTGQELENGGIGEFTDLPPRIALSPAAPRIAMCADCTPIALTPVTPIALSPDKQFMIQAEGIAATLIDMKTMKPVRQFIGHTTDIHALTYSADGRRIFTASRDGMVKIWEGESGKELMTLVALGRDASLALTPDHFYRTSKRAIKGLAFRVNETVYPFEQFDLRFNRPDIVMERLGLASPEEIQYYRQAYLRRLAKMKYTEQMVDSQFHVPEIRLLSKRPPLRTSANAMTMRIHASDSQYGLDRLNLYLNDVPLHGQAGVPLVDKGVQTVETDISVPLARGRNKIQVSTHNVKGVESRRETVYVNVTRELPAPSIYLVAIGVSHYRDPVYNLQYAAKDAEDLAALYRGLDKSSHYKAIHVRTLTDAQAVRANIGAIKDFLRLAQLDDLIVVFAAGHGLVDQEQNYYFGTYDVDVTQPGKNGLPYEALEDLLDGIPALQKLLLVDTCFSGEIDKTERRLVTNQLSEGQADAHVTVRRFIPQRGVAIKQGQVQQQKLRARDLQVQADIFADLRRGTGAVVISSSSGDEYAFEDDKWKNGAFTYSVLKGLKERAADHNQDGHIFVSELQQYVSKQVPQLTQGGQNPTVRQENLENDFVLY